MPVLEARGEPLYLVDRCAPCKGYRSLLRPSSPYRWSLDPLPLLRGPCMRALLRPTVFVQRNGTTPRRDSPGRHVYYFNVEASPEIQQPGHGPPLPSPPPPIAPLQANKIRGTKGPVNKLRGTRPTAPTFSLSRTGGGGGGKNRFGTQ